MAKGFTMVHYMQGVNRCLYWFSVAYVEEVDDQCTGRSDWA